MLGEIQILRQLAKIPGNVYMTMLLDLIVTFDQNDTETLDSVFLVMNYCTGDLYSSLNARNCK